MDSAPPPPAILETLRTVEFRLGLKGYNVDEVDEYLEKAAVEAEALHEQFRQANERLRQATERISQLEAERRSSPAAPAAGGAGAAPGPAPAPPAPTRAWAGRCPASRRCAGSWPGTWRTSHATSRRSGRGCARRCPRSSS